MELYQTETRVDNGQPEDKRRKTKGIEEEEDRQR